MTETTHRNALPAGHKLHWYTIERTLGQGGFGITYLARDENLNRQVAIKEYLPRELAVRERDDSVHPLSEDHSGQFRWGLDRFIAEARTLAQFRHPNIVRVLTVFEANHTAYMVMEYERGEALHEVLAGHRTLPEPELRRIVTPLLDGLEKVHAAGFIHRDIKPANIFLREDGSPVLLDFGSARQALGEATCTLTSLVSPGYAPFEQYVAKSDKQGPWTDIYGLGATLYRAVTGRAPVEAVDRSESLLHGEADPYRRCAETAAPAVWSPALLAAVDHALAFKPLERPQSVAEWRRELEGAAPAAVTVAAATTVVATHPPPAPLAPVIVPAKPARPRRRALIMAVVAAFVLALGVIKHQAGRPPQAPLPAETVVASPPPVSAPAVPAAASPAGTVPVTDESLAATTERAPSAAAVGPALEAQTGAEPVVPPSPSPPAAAKPVDAGAIEPAEGAAAEAARQAPPEPVVEPTATGNGADAAPRAEEPPRRAALPRAADPDAQLRKAQRVLSLVGKAREAERRGDLDRAEALLNEALKIAPRNAKLIERKRLLARARLDRERR